MAEHHHKYTGALLLLFTALVLLAAILFTMAQTRITQIDEYKIGNAKLGNAKNNMIIAYILGYIATGIALVLAILYFGHVTWGISTEWPHLIIFILLFALIIVSAIFGFLALSDISSADPSNKKGSTGWIWGGLISLLVAVIVLIISGAWRAQYNSSKTETQTKTTSMTFTSPESLSSGAPSYSAPTVDSSTASSGYTSVESPYGAEIEY